MNRKGVHTVIFYGFICELLVANNIWCKQKLHPCEWLAQWSVGQTVVVTLSDLTQPSLSICAAVVVDLAQSIREELSELKISEIGEE